MDPAYKTGRTIDDHLSEIEGGSHPDPDDWIWYVTYSDVYHTSHECPHLAQSDSVFRAGGLHSLSMAREPGLKGPRDPLTDMDECGWCADRGQ